MTDSIFSKETNLGALVASHVDQSQPWLIEVSGDDSQRVYTYAEFHQLTAAVARSLTKRGLKPNTRIGLLGLNSAEYLLTYYGIMQAGHCAVPIGYKLAKETVHYILKDADIELLYIDSEWAACIDNVAKLSLDDRIEWQSQLDIGHFDITPAQSDDAATILYTSGSTGIPKGVPLTHAGYIWTLDQVAVNGGRFIRDRAAAVLTAAPLSHMNALFLAKTVTAYGGTLVMMTQFDAANFLKTCASYRCNVVTAVPTMLALCAQETDTLAQLDLGFVESVGIGSAPITDTLFVQIGLMFPNATIQNGWGSTETGPAVFGPHPKGLPRPKLSLGYPLSDVEVRLEGSDGQGELYVRNRAIMPGYINRDDETRLRIKDGWYRTGDVMRRDENGFYYFVGRADDMFVCGGENMYPGEIELLLEKHPAVAQAAVVPVVDKIRGHVPAAFIVRHQGSVVTEEEIKQFALANGPVYQYPRFIRFIDEMPLSAANKIDKKRIQEISSGLRR